MTQLNCPSDAESVFSIGPTTTLKLNLDDSEAGVAETKVLGFVRMEGSYNNRRELIVNMIEAIKHLHVIFRTNFIESYTGGVWFQYMHQYEEAILADQAIRALNLMINGEDSQGSLF